MKRSKTALETPLRRRAEKPAPRRIHYDVDEDDEDDVRIQSGKHKAKGISFINVLVHLIATTASFIC